MIAVVCLDDNGGMAFNSRRQSRDRELIRDLLETVGEKKLVIGEYSLPLFGDADVLVSSDPLTEAGEGDYCFIERETVSELDRIEGFLIYRWNRSYPSDLTFDVDLAAEGYSLVSEREFPGFSHETITVEEYRR